MNEDNKVNDYKLVTIQKMINKIKDGDCMPSYHVGGYELPIHDIKEDVDRLVIAYLEEQVRNLSRKLVN